MRLAAWVVAVAAALAALWALATFVFLSLAGLPWSLASPRTLWAYWRAYPGQARVVYPLAASVGLSALLGVALALSAAVGAARKRRAAGASARFASLWEVARAGMLAGSVRTLDAPGLLLAQKGRRWVVDQGAGHVAAPWPTDSGKSRSLVMPNLLNWRGSVFALDIKGELYANTAGWRSTLGEVFVLDPLNEDGRTHRLNPLDMIGQGAMRTTDMLTVVHMLIRDGGKEPFWKAGARDYFLGLLMLMDESPGVPRTLGQAWRLAMHPDGDANYLAWVLDEAEAGRRALSPRCVQLLASYVQTPEKQREGFRREVTAALELWSDERVDAATSASDFDPRTMRHRPITVYLKVPAHALDQLAPLAALCFETIFSANLRGLPGNDPRITTPLLMLPDEIGQLPRLQSIVRGSTLARGFGIRLILPFQDNAQMRAVYGADVAASLVSNCATSLAVATPEQAEARRVSDALGLRTVKRRSIARNGRGGSTSETERQEPLLAAQQVRLIARDEVIVLPSSVLAFRAKKLDLSMRCFAERASMTPPAVPALAESLEVPIERIPRDEAPDEAPEPAPAVQPKSGTRAPAKRAPKPTPEEIAMAAELLQAKGADK